jgi:hypothetical protein
MPSIHIFDELLFLYIITIALLADGGGAAMCSMGLYKFICGIGYTSRYVTVGRKRGPE